MQSAEALLPNLSKSRLALFGARAVYITEPCGQTISRINLAILFLVESLIRYSATATMHSWSGIRVV